jgi:hypothetical protein
VQTIGPALALTADLAIAATRTDRLRLGSIARCEQNRGCRGTEAISAKQQAVVVRASEPSARLTCCLSIAADIVALIMER